MKTFRVICVLAVLFTSAALGIPQTIQGNTFFAAAGVQFEQFAADPATWETGAELKGRWNSQGSTLTLADSATVFGLAADEITAERKDGRVQTIRVLFRAGKKRNGKSVDLLGQVVANLRAFTGETGVSAPSGGAVFTRRTVKIIARPAAAGEVIVEFTRA